MVAEAELVLAGHHHRDLVRGVLDTVDPEHHVAQRVLDFELEFARRVVFECAVEVRVGDCLVVDDVLHHFRRSLLMLTYHVLSMAQRDGVEVRLSRAVVRLHPREGVVSDGRLFDGDVLVVVCHLAGSSRDQ